jgi:hypothetical protein
VQLLSQFLADEFLVPKRVTEHKAIALQQPLLKMEWPVHFINIRFGSNGGGGGGGVESSHECGPINDRQ